MPKWRLSILQTTGSDEVRWQERFGGLAPDNRDIHYTADYAHIYELTYGQTAYLAVFGDEENYVLLPFIRYDVADLPFMQGYADKSPVYDIASLYGYGGPLARVTDQLSTALYDGFFTAFHAYCLETGIVDEYARLHPLLGNHLPLQAGAWVELVQRKPVIYFDLDQDEAMLWRGLCRGHRSSINKARRHGVQVVREKVAGEALAVFRRLYAETMDRAQASESWRFPESYFVNCAECLGEQHISLFSARLGDVTVASYLIIHAYHTAYYHFGGSDEAYFDIRGNNLLLYEIALWAKAQGYHWFHLGGGRLPDDGVYRFKSGFTKNTAWLYTYSLIHDENRYAHLCAMRDAWNQAHSVEPGNSSFFPAYRR